MAPNYNLQNLTAFITGGTKGIGLAIAQLMAANGAKIIISARNIPTDFSNDFEYWPCDFSERAQVQNLALKIKNQKIDILVNNAGINKIGAFSSYDLADFDAIHEVNVRTPFALCQAVLDGMRQRNWGRIVNISSIFGKISKEHRAAYSSSKFALDGMTVALAAEVTEHGILANCISPGFIDTELTRRTLGDSGIAKLTAQVPAKRLGQSSEVAELVAWLCSPQNTFVSGQNIAIDGGFSRV